MIKIASVIFSGKAEGGCTRDISLGTSEKCFYKKNINYYMSVCFWGCWLSVWNFQTLLTLLRFSGGIEWSIPPLICVTVAELKVKNLKKILKLVPQFIIVG